MLFGFFWGDWTVIVLLPAMIFAFIAQASVQSTFNRFNKVATARRISGAEAARRILDKNGLYQVKVERVRGHLSDHYDPRTETLRLSEATHDSVSVAALGVAAHEAGHAIQHAKGYAPLKLRMAMIPVTQFGSSLAMPLFLIGFFMSIYAAEGSVFGEFMMFAGIILFSLSTFFQLVTLPVEFNASRRAMTVLEESEILIGDELSGAKKTLNAAAMTYVAALATSLAYLLRFLLLASSASGRRRN